MQEKNNRELLIRIGEVLYYCWDPIGVSEEVYARDEYDGYVWQIFSLLKGGIATQALSEYLTRIATEQMGLETNVDNDLKSAHLLIEWLNFYKEKE